MEDEDTPTGNLSCRECGKRTSRCVKLTSRDNNGPAVMCWPCFKPYAYRMSEDPGGGIYASDLGEVHFSYDLLEELRAKGMLHRLAPQGVSLQKHDSAKRYDTTTGQITECEEPTGLRRRFSGSDSLRDVYNSLFGASSAAQSVFATASPLARSDRTATDGARGLPSQNGEVLEGTTSLPAGESHAAVSDVPEPPTPPGLHRSSSLPVRTGGGLRPALGEGGIGVDAVHTLFFGPNAEPAAASAPCAMDAVFSSTSHIVNPCS